MSDDLKNQKELIEERVIKGNSRTVLMDVPGDFGKRNVIGILNILKRESREYWNKFDDKEAFGEMNAYNKAIGIIKKWWKTVRVVEIEITGDNWIWGKSKLRPQDKQLCVVIINPEMSAELPRICQYRAKNREYVSKDEIFYQHEIQYWKPIEFPEDMNRRILSEIEGRFKEC